MYLFVLFMPIEDNNYLMHPELVADFNAENKLDCVSSVKMTNVGSA